MDKVVNENFFLRFKRILSVNKNKTNIFFIVLFIIIFFCMSLFLINRTEFLINSDMAGELMLAKELASGQGFILTTEWFYSTELRIFNTQIINQILFYFTNDWSVLRAISIVIHMFLLVISGYYLLTKFKFSNKWHMFMGCSLLLIPLSYDYLFTVFVGTFVISHFIMSFIYIALFYSIYQNKSNERKAKIVKVLFLLFSFICGMSTIRYLLVFQIPLFITVLIIFLIENKDIINANTFSFQNLKDLFIKNKERWIKYSFALTGLLCGILGCIFEILVLSKFFTFFRYSSMSFVDWTDTSIFDNVNHIFKELFVSLGYVAGSNFFSIQGIINILLMIFIFCFIYSIVYLFKSKDVCFEKKVMVLFFTISFIFNSFVFLITPIDFYAPRYYYPILIFAAPCIIIYISEEKRPIFRLPFIWLTTITFLLGTTVFMFNLKDINAILKYEGAKQYLVENDYNFGYATFWNANIFTEMTDGSIEIASVFEQETMNRFNWLTPKKYDEIGYHNGKTFIIASIEENEEYADSSILLGGTIVYTDDYFVIYSYDSVDEINNLMNSGG